MDADVLQQVREILDSQPEWLEVRTRLVALTPEGHEEWYRPLVFAFGYRLLEQSREEIRVQAGGPFGPATSDGAWQFPRALVMVEDQDVAAWQEAADALDDPVSKARLHDLLWERRAGPRPDQHARSAVDAYLQLVELTHWHLVDRSRCLSRALELSRAVTDVDRFDVVSARCQTFVADVVAMERRGPGPAITILRALVDLPAERRPPNLDEMLRAAVNRFGDDPHLFDALTELQTRIVDKDGQLALRREQVAHWREASKDGDAFLRVIRLEQALEVARTHGLAGDADAIRRELQEIKPGDLDLQAVSAKVELSADDVRAYIDSFVEVADWRESLRHFGSEPPPGGSTEDIDEQLDQEEQEFVFQQLFTRTVMGHGTAATRIRAADPATKRQLARAERRAWYARMWSHLAADVLYEIPKRHSRPGHGELSAFFATELIGPRRAERIARAVELFWDDQPDECAHVLVPRLESAVRDMARRAGLTIIREPVADVPGGARSLGTLLLELRDALPEPAWHEYLTNLLTDQMGVNLRNTIAHGLVDQVGHGDAALLIHAACYLRLLGVPD